MAKILIVDDHIPFRTIFSETVSALNHEVLEAGSGTEALKVLQSVVPDLVFLDLRMPDMDGMEVLRQVRNLAAFKNLPVVILTGYADSTNTIEAIKLGAFDHMTKPVGRKDLKDVIDRALDDANREPAQSDSTEANTVPEDEILIGASKAFRDVEKLIGFAVSARSPVLISGETGSGKKQIARVIHKHSDASHETLHIVPCSHPGSFFDRWNQLDSVYLEELQDLNSSDQAKLVSLMQDAQKNGKPRVISSSRHDLAASVKEKSFREDLYYHLSVFPIYVPPLRNRGSDILVLAEAFLSRLMPDSPKVLTSSASKTLLEYNWPGNVRELQNVMQRAHMVARGRAIDVQDLGLTSVSAASEASVGDLLQLDFYSAIARLEKMLLTKALSESEGNRTETARRLGINRQLLYSKLKEHGLD